MAQYVNVRAAKREKGNMDVATMKAAFNTISFRNQEPSAVSFPYHISTVWCLTELWELRITHIIHVRGQNKNDLLSHNLSIILSSIIDRKIVRLLVISVMSRRSLYYSRQITNHIVKNIRNTFHATLVVTRLGISCISSCIYSAYSAYMIRRIMWRIRGWVGLI